MESRKLATLRDTDHTGHTSRDPGEDVVDARPKIEDRDDEIGEEHVLLRYPPYWLVAYGHPGYPYA